MLVGGINSCQEAPKLQGAGGTIGANAFRTTNSLSQSAMRGVEFHGNTRRDGQPAYPVYIGMFCAKGVVQNGFISWPPACTEALNKILAVLFRAA